MKKLIMILILFCVGLVLLLWIIGFFFVNDFSVPSTSLSKYKKILIIFPHADDEVLAASGLIQIAARAKIPVTLAILTKGEKGNPSGKLDPQLKEIRTAEAQEVANLIGVSRLIQKDFGDGELEKKRDELQKYIAYLLTEENPDLVITYDRAGLYGHEDHIVCSEIITDLLRKNNTIDLWYTTYPKRVLSMVQLPEHMAKDPQYKNKRVYPTSKLFVSWDNFKKIQAVYKYKSQYQSFRDAVPMKPIPLWFFYSMWWYEYFYEV